MSTFPFREDHSIMAALERNTSIMCWMDNTVRLLGSKVGEVLGKPCQKCWTKMERGLNHLTGSPKQEMDDALTIRHNCLGIKTHMENLWVEMVASVKDKCYETEIFRMWRGGLIHLRGFQKEEWSRKADPKAAEDLPYNFWILCTWLMSTAEPSWVTIPITLSGARGLFDRDKTRKHMAFWPWAALSCNSAFNGYN